jgi:predicted RND superfamily exporter protein
LTGDPAARYVGWLRRNALGIVAVTTALLAGAIHLILFHLPLFADFSHLLPDDAPAVRDLRRLEARMVAVDTALVVIVAPDPARREAAARDVAAAVRALDAGLVKRVETDDAEARAFVRARRHLFVPYADLVRARDTLAARIAQAKLAANPLYVDLGDDAAAPDAAATERDLERLRAKRREAEARLDRSGFVSADGKTALVVVETAFRATDVDRGARLLAAIDAIGARAAAAHPGVELGVAGSVPTAVTEHRALARGMLWSSVLTAGLVGLLLLVYLRSAVLLALLSVNLAIATTLAFGAAAITIGHLNAATAFLGAIIAGNGVNYGILLVVRFREERAAREPEDAMARAIAATFRPTLVASLGAAIAYGSLAATSFRGFADFAVIGAIGMLLCWIASYVVLPAVVLRIGAASRAPRAGANMLGRGLAAVFGAPPAWAIGAVIAGLAIAAAAVSAVYIAEDPFEYDITNLRSEGADAVRARHWMEVSDRELGRGIANRTYIAANRRSQVPAIVDALRELDARTPPDEKTIGEIASLVDLVPPDQRRRLAVLAEIRALLDDDALEALDDDARAELRELRPPDDLRPIRIADLPDGLRERLTDRGGGVGYVIAVRAAPDVDEWDGRDLIRFAGAVRELHLPGGETVTTSGSAVIFADVVAAIRADGARVALYAALGLVVMVALLGGSRRAVAAVLVATAAGSALMIAACALAGLKVNFLDFVALPITLGLGIDYAINLAHRAETADRATTLRTTGAAVLVCSLTTVIGYGSLLVSDNLAIRGFGLASLIGEVTCVIVALAIVPMIVSRARS